MCPRTLEFTFALVGWQKLAERDPVGNPDDCHRVAPEQHVSILFIAVLFSSFGVRQKQLNLTWQLPLRPTPKLCVDKAIFVPNQKRSIRFLGIWSFSAWGSNSETQQFGTNLQLGGLGRFVVDLETDLAGFLHEIDHAPRFNELIGVAHREDGIAVQALDDFGETLFFGVTDEKNLAVSGLGGGVEDLD